MQRHTAYETEIAIVLHTATEKENRSVGDTTVHSRLVGLSEAVLNICEKCVRVDRLAHDASEVGGIDR